MTEPDRAPTARSRIRPYLLTGGRTRSAVDLPLEAQIRTTAEGADAAHGQATEQRAIIELCDKPYSVGEISALLKIHLQVTRILVGDLLDAGMVTADATPNAGSDRPDLPLLERVLSGLQAL